MVANEGLENARSLFRPSSPGPTALHPLRRMWCKLLMKAPSEYTYSLFGAELSRLLGEKIPVAIVSWNLGPLVYSPAL